VWEHLVLDMELRGTEGRYAWWLMKVSTKAVTA